ncbi:glycosyltransferase family 4 protein [Bacteroidales bacterium OttesenSCG-928-B11]|nr:glycosyltransferase family 4 protein [Bacteroidales bacterium OttesenSCG-928-E04]MDL2308192.1 glycosyltransferase family 4 protein [Bacteroidales bacterium OttesenSCG-928-C03]MDL2312593.1 glycosyltransferase family 4 protein [Bacteroidales bacterium OttesenSCG-928-B11]MDL2325631.1 glycosyltransferase family 4 protein [Bacteroidales bacterium OttesenSCG-928-A14]
MKIGFEAKRAFFNASGLGNYSRNIISALHQYYPENDYFLFTPKYSEERFAMPEASIVMPGNGWKHFPALWRFMGMDTAIQQHNIDIFHGLSNELPRGIEQCEAKSVVTIHDLIFMRYPHWYKLHDRKIYRNKVKYACKVADKIVAISQQTKEDLIHFLNVPEEKITVIYQPAFIHFLQNERNEELEMQTVLKYQLPEHYLLMVGNIEKRKNIANVIMAKVEGKIDTPLYIVGRENSYAEKLRSDVERLGIDDIYFLHQVSSKELAVFYRNADMLIYPSYFEGFGLPVIEALSCGIPVIASTGSCLSETAGEGALYVNPDDTEEIAVAIRRLLNDKTLRQELVQKGQQHIRQFEPEIIARQIYELYQSLLK